MEQDRLDPAVVAALYDDYGGELRAFLTGVLRNCDLVSEALQATFARTLEAGHTSGVETRKGWLFRVALNEALVLKRRRKREAESVRRMAESIGTFEDESPEGFASRRETVESIRAALEQLPEEQRRVVQMRIEEGLTFADIARQLQLPLGTALTRMRLALRRLAEALKSQAGP